MPKSMKIAIKPKKFLNIVYENKIYKKKKYINCVQDSSHLKVTFTKQIFNLLCNTFNI